jgi:hypothetical protein
VKKIIIIGLIALISVTAAVLVFYMPLTSVENDRTVVDVAMNQTNDGNFNLYVSNQSPTISLVDITIYIDDKLALKGNFDVGNQHYGRSFQFSLSNGTHKFYAESIGGTAKLEGEFEITGKQYAELGYWHNPDYGSRKYFSFNIQNIDFALNNTQ